MITAVCSTSPQSGLALVPRRGPGVAVLAVLVGSLIACGCGGATGPVRAAATGAVSLDGTPLKEGTIRFVPTGNTKGPAAVARIREGAFEFPKGEGPLVGTHRVEIESFAEAPFAIDDEQAYALHAEQGPPPVAVNRIPESYNRQSTLTAEVKSDGPNKFQFSVTSNGAP